MSFKLLRLVSCWNTPGPLGWLDHPSGVENLADSQVILGVNNIWWFQFYDNQLQVLLYYYSVLFIIIFLKNIFWFLTTYYLLLFLSLLPSSHDDGYQHFVPINPSSEVHVCSFPLEAQEEQQCIRRRGRPWLRRCNDLLEICWPKIGSWIICNMLSCWWSIENTMLTMVALLKTQ